MNKIANVKCCFHKLHVSALPKRTLLRVVSRLSEPCEIVIYQHFKNAKYYITYRIGDVTSMLWTEEFDFDLHMPLLLEIISNVVSAYEMSNSRYIEQPMLACHAVLRPSFAKD